MRRSKVVSTPAFLNVLCPILMGFILHGTSKHSFLLSCDASFWSQKTIILTSCLSQHLGHGNCMQLWILNFWAYLDSGSPPILDLVFCHGFSGESAGHLWTSVVVRREVSGVVLPSATMPPWSILGRSRQLREGQASTFAAGENSISDVFYVYTDIIRYQYKQQDIAE